MNSKIVGNAENFLNIIGCNYLGGLILQCHVRLSLKLSLKVNLHVCLPWWLFFNTGVGLTSPNSLFSENKQKECCIKTRLS